jgi:hypothetical protein
VPEAPRPSAPEPPEVPGPAPAPEPAPQVPGPAPGREPAPHHELPVAGSPSPPAPRRRPTRGGVAVVAGGLLQDLEDRLRRDLAPIEEQVRAGEELRGLAGGTIQAAGGDHPLVVLLPPPLTVPNVEEPGGRS